MSPAYSDDDWHEKQFGTPSLATEQEAVRDAYVAQLESALRRIATVPALGSSIARTLDQCILLARDALGSGDIERIPDSITIPAHGEIAFTRYPVADGGWHLIGPAVALEPGTVVEVQRFRDKEPTLTAVGQIVAERTVIHRDRGPVQYVVARVSKAVRD